MHLAQFMDKFDLDEKRMAKILQCTRETVNRYKNRQLVPGNLRMIQIWEITGGRVTPSDLKRVANGS